MSLHSGTLSWFRSNQSLLLLFNFTRLVEEQQIKYQFLVFGLTVHGLKPMWVTIYHSRAEHVCHYTTHLIRSKKLTLDYIFQYICKPVMGFFCKSYKPSLFFSCSGCHQYVFFLCLQESYLFLHHGDLMGRGESHVKSKMATYHRRK